MQEKQAHAASGTPKEGKQHKNGGGPITEPVTAAAAGYEAQAEVQPEVVKELTKPELRALFAEYDKANKLIDEREALLEEAKHARSEIVRKIAKGSTRKSFTIKETGMVYTIMSRKNDATGEDWYYFRSPTIPDSLEL